MWSSHSTVRSRVIHTTDWASETPLKDIFGIKCNDISNLLQKINLKINYNMSKGLILVKFRWYTHGCISQLLLCNKIPNPEWFNRITLYSLSSVCGSSGGKRVSAALPRAGLLYFTQSLEGSASWATSFSWLWQKLKQAHLITQTYRKPCLHPIDQDKLHDQAQPSTREHVLCL